MIEYGTNRLAGRRQEAILEAWDQSLVVLVVQKERRIPPLWDRLAGPLCLAALRQFPLRQCASEIQTR
jgi:hypothetical protein